MSEEKHTASNAGNQKSEKKIEWTTIIAGLSATQHNRNQLMVRLLSPSQPLRGVEPVRLRRTGRHHLGTSPEVTSGAKNSISRRHARAFFLRVSKGSQPKKRATVRQTQRLRLSSRPNSMVINLTTAKALGLKIPEAFLLRADEVIE